VADGYYCQPNSLALHLRAVCVVTFGDQLLKQVTMPANEIHRLIDLIAFGNDYGWLHRAKDYPSKYLGQSHRRARHYGHAEWIQKLESLGNRSRDREVRQSDEGHDLIDRTWSSLTDDEKLGWAAAFKDVALHPESYPNLFMPDDYDKALKSEAFIRLQGRFALLPLEYIAGIRA
jgi:hypothetical protein